MDVNPIALLDVLAGGSRGLLGLSSHKGTLMLHKYFPPIVFCLRFVICILNISSIIGENKALKIHGTVPEALKSFGLSHIDAMKSQAVWITLDSSPYEVAHPSQTSVKLMNIQEFTSMDSQNHHKSLDQRENHQEKEVNYS